MWHLFVYDSWIAWCYGIAIIYDAYELHPDAALYAATDSAGTYIRLNAGLDKNTDEASDGGTGFRTVTSSSNVHSAIAPLLIAVTVAGMSYAITWSLPISAFSSIVARVGGSTRLVMLFKWA